MKIIALSALALLTACSGGASDQAEAQADKLDNAAEQSTPEAAAVLENQADAIRANGATGAVGEPGSTAQQAMEQAGQAQADATAAPAASATPPSRQAVPHGAEKGNPPPKTDTK
jgi:hypothetical protein